MCFGDSNHFVSSCRSSNPLARVMETWIGDTVASLNNYSECLYYGNSDLNDFLKNQIDL